MEVIVCVFPKILIIKKYLTLTNKMFVKKTKQMAEEKSASVTAAKLIDLGKTATSNNTAIKDTVGYKAKEFAPK